MINNIFWNYFNDIAAPQLQHRSRSFRIAFEHLQNLNRPVCIVETGCVRDTRIDAVTTEGQSTVLFDKFSESVPGTVIHSVDINDKNVETCKSLVSDRVQVHTSDSVNFLRNKCANLIHPFTSIDLLYLDSYDVDMENAHDAAIHCMNELFAASHLITENTLILIDDSPATASIIEGSFKRITPFVTNGKGKYVASYMQSIGRTPFIKGFQIGWLGL